MKEEQEYIDAIEADVRWLGFDWGEHLYYASDYFEQLYEWAVGLIKAGKAYVDDLSADEIREHRGTFTEAGTRQPVARPAGRREPRPLRAHARRGVPGRRARPAREDRHGRAQHQPARPGAVPHPARRASAHRRRLVRLSHLRLRARAVGRHRGHHALHLHARVRGAPAALRLAHREPAGAVAAAPVRVRAPQPHAHRAQQARAAAPGERGARARLGRPAHADHVGAAPARVPRRGHPRLRHAGRRRQGGQHRRGRVCSSTRCATCSTAQRSRRFAVLDPLKVVITNYPEGQIEEMDVPNNPEDPEAGTRKVPFSRELWIERDDFMEEPVRKFFRLAPGREVRLRAAYFVTCTEVVKDDGRGDRGAALHARPGHARRRRSRRPPPQGHPALGLGRSRRAGRGPPVRRTSSRTRTRAPTAATSSRP